MRAVLVLSLCLLGCGPRGAYLKAPIPGENLNPALAGVSFDVAPSGACAVTLDIKGAGIGVLQAPRQWCVDAKRAKALIYQAQQHADGHAAPAK